MIIPHDTSRKWDTLLADTKERLAAAAKISAATASTMMLAFLFAI